MKLYLKIICVLLAGLMFFGFIMYLVLAGINKEQLLEHVNSPTEFIMENGNGIRLSDYSTFDSKYTEYNKELAKKLKITEDEAFILGNLGKYWAKNLIEGKKIRFENGDILHNGFGYVLKFEKSPFCIKNNEITNKIAFEKELKTIRHGNFVIVDLDTDSVYAISKENANKLKNFVVIRKSHIKSNTNSKTNIAEYDILPKTSFSKTNIKLVLSDLTTKIIPDRNCSSDICKEILFNINNAKSNIDMAIYGYSSTPAIENALKEAEKRGVNIRIVYDIDAKGGNIYPDTFGFINNFAKTMNDKNSAEVRNTMHNKFYIFDNQTVITGSANLSHTDMSGYNSNSIIIINSPEVAKFYTQEFNQMYDGKFHNKKTSYSNKNYENITVYFSPQDKAVTNGVLPLIKKAKTYIYIPAFVITEKRITAELIKAKQRGVEIKILADALNSFTQHSKSKELRTSGILVKAENYAGKMHSKSMIIDDKYIIIGSMNFSNSGENRNDENLVIIEDSEAAKFYKAFFLYQWNKIPDKWLKYTPRAEGKDSIGSCSDGIDNNYDGYTDGDDPACSNVK